MLIKLEAMHDKIREVVEVRRAALRKVCTAATTTEADWDAWVRASRKLDELQRQAAKLVHDDSEFRSRNLRYRSPNVAKKKEPEENAKGAELPDAVEEKPAPNADAQAAPPTPKKGEVETEEEIGPELKPAVEALKTAGFGTVEIVALVLEQGLSLVGQVRKLVQDRRAGRMVAASDEVLLARACKAATVKGDAAVQPK